MLYHKHKTKLLAERNKVLKDLEDIESLISNLAKFISFAVKTTPKILNIWNKQNYEKRTILRILYF